MQDFENMSREEAIAMCKTLWQKNADLEKNCDLYLSQLAKNKVKMFGRSSEKKCAGDAG